MAGARAILPAASALSAPLREAALTEAKLLPLAMVILPPASFRVLRSARPVTATAPLVLMSPLDTTVRVSTVTAARVTPSAFSSRLPAVVIPTVFTVPTTNGPAVCTLAVPVLPARTGMVLVSRVRAKLPPVPSSSSPAVARSWVWVTAPVVARVRLPLVVSPVLLTLPISKPEFSRNATVPVLPARVVMVLPVLFKV